MIAIICNEKGTALDILQQIIARLGSRARSLHMEAGQTLFRQGEPARGMFILSTGRARLVRHAADGAQVILHLVTPQESFAEPSLFAEVYHCECQIGARSRVIHLPGADMRRLLAEDARIAEAFMARLAAQVRGLRGNLELRNIRRAEERLLAALRLHAGPDGKIVLPETFKALAAQLGMAHETLYRALAKLQRSGHIHRREGGISLTLNT